jgi:hypothetical protein
MMDPQSQKAAMRCDARLHITAKDMPVVRCVDDDEFLLAGASDGLKQNQKPKITFIITKYKGTENRILKKSE